MRSILLVDDDRDVRAFCRQVLDKAGYKVLEASSGAEAQQVWEVAKKIDLLLTDHDMPGVTGIQLSGILLSRQEDLRIILMSGSCPDSIEVPDHIRFLQKPFIPAALTDLVHLALTHAPSCLPAGRCSPVVERSLA